MGSIVVLADCENGLIRPQTLELIAAGRLIAAHDSQASLSIVALSCPQEAAQDVISRGADEVFWTNDERLALMGNEIKAALISRIISNLKPSLILASTSASAKELTGRLMARLKCAFSSGVSQVEIGSGSGDLEMGRPCFGGRKIARVRFSEHVPVILSLKPRAVQTLNKDTTRSGRVEEIRLTEEDFRGPRQRVIQFVKSETREKDVADADIIVSGGRGMNGPDNFKILRELAEALDAAVGASRVAVDLGWISYPHQVGQTGKTVKPKLYIACGISGAIQHLFGMRQSDRIIVINKDATAPILQIADFAIIGDLFEIVPALTKKLREVLGK